MATAKRYRVRVLREFRDRYWYVEDTEDASGQAVMERYFWTRQQADEFAAEMNAEASDG